MISISVVSHDQKELVQALFSDIKRLAPPLVKQIILTHNNTDDRELFPNEIAHIRIVQIFNPQNKGFGDNHNSAFRSASQQYFAVLNPDLRLTLDPFPSLLNALSNPLCGLVGPRIVNANGEIANSARKLYTPLQILNNYLGLTSYTTRPDWLAGMFLLFRSEAFRSVNGFDEKFFMYVEDVDISSRLVLKGWFLRHDTSAEVIHVARRASRRSLRHFSWHIHSAFIWWTSSTFWRYRKVLLKANAK
jgi:N-acetylglucosaminyl-diphospho-decaprenol L-rhamnosyltransferase